MALGLRDVVVLPPSPHQPCVLRLDRAVTVAAVKDRLFHRRGWRPEAQVLRLEGQRDEVSDDALLQALGGARAPGVGWAPAAGPWAARCPCLRAARLPRAASAAA